MAEKKNKKGQPISRLKAVKADKVAYANNGNQLDILNKLIRQLKDRGIIG